MLTLQWQQKGKQLVDMMCVVVTAIVEGKRRRRKSSQIFFEMEKSSVKAELKKETTRK